jgi:hypothetical protein
MIKIAIIGANGQISKGLASVFSAQENYQLFLFSRNPVDPFLIRFYSSFLRPGVDKLLSLDDFEIHKYDVVINSAGEGSPVEQAKLGFSLFQMSEALDNRILRYIEQNPETLYFFLSSGAVYGINYEWPVSIDTLTSWSANKPSENSIYVLAKITAEARHFHLSNYLIYDIRIFGYFSRYIGLRSSFFLSELAYSVAEHIPFNTTRRNMVRDYIDHFELSNLISLLISKRPMSGPFDIYSLESISKTELLSRLQKYHGLMINYSDSDPGNYPVDNISTKPGMHPSNLNSIKELGHLPRRSSLEIVSEELHMLIKSTKVNSV